MTTNTIQRKNFASVIQQLKVDLGYIGPLYSRILYKKIILAIVNYIVKFLSITPFLNHWMRGKINPRHCAGEIDRFAYLGIMGTMSIASTRAKKTLLLLLTLKLIANIRQ